jgi:carbonic anhydrase
MDFDRRRALKVMATLAACPLCNIGALAAEGHHWGYEGADGPDHWGDLDAASKVCSTGSQQSPIDIEGSIEADLPPLKIQWAKSAETIVNNGHTIQLNAAPGSTLMLGDDEYKLVQFHFHRPSEHLINGKSFPMEAHFVHQHASGRLAVVGVLMSAGKENPAFNKVAATMPDKEGPAAKADPAIDPNGFLPGDLDYYRYNGSLTTPPCAETVAWLLLTEPIEVAEADVAAFAKLYPMNARPVQMDNRRFVLRSG